LKKLLLALGSDILMDDAVSLFLAKDLKRSFQDFTLLFLPVGGMDLIELIAGFDLVVIIDTMIIPGTQPGEIIHFNELQSVTTLHLQNPHDIDFYTSLRLAEGSGYRLPERIAVLGVTIRQQMIASGELPDWFNEKYDSMMEKLVALIQAVNE
jgi:hydrogenase maturation protease